ncbi:DUF5319 family protein [Epidermidibacterium keratini]|uniref:DUF5319 family protein n=1 Tax=Epidermidibacterium keratini TaxID=1891644 RepID=UPI001CEF686F|nr:DUF5319 family protein [Epidermidibacterium keratini]
MAFPHRDDPDESARRDRIARELFESLAPLDPFLDDLNDPSAELEREPDPEPLDDEAKRMVLEDLHDLDEFQSLLEPRGVRGICMECAGCEEMHYYEWEIMRSNLLNMLAHHQAHVHEPPFNPKPEEFVSWDYANGYADAVIELSSDE